jgi:hypothetical protein
VSPLVFKMVEKLLNSAAELRRVVWGLEETAVGMAQAPVPDVVQSGVKMARDSATVLKASAAGLLATVERVERLCAIEHSPSTAHTVGKVETLGTFRESAANVLAAALVKAKDGNIAQGSDWKPALHAAATAVDAMADYVVARIMYELRSGCSESGIFAVAAAREEEGNR